MAAQVRTITAALKTQLAAQIVGTGDYSNNIGARVYNGDRLPEGAQRPAVCVSTFREITGEQWLSGCAPRTTKIRVIGYIQDKSFAGDDARSGALANMVNDIIRAIQADSSLNGSCTYARCLAARFDESAEGVLANIVEVDVSIDYFTTTGATL